MFVFYILKVIFFLYFLNFCVSFAQFRGNCHHRKTPLDGSVLPMHSSAAILSAHLLAELYIRGSNCSRCHAFFPFIFSSLPFEGSPTELFGDIFHILPRLNSDFLNTSWQTSRNIPAPQRLPKGCSSSSSSPKPQSVISPGPPPSPRLLAKSPQSPILSPQPSSPHSQSSGAFQIKSPDKDSPQSGSSELHSTFLSPKSLIKRCPDSPLPGTKIAKRRTQGVAAANKTLIEKLPSPVSPQEHCSPIRPLSATSCNDESLQHSGICNMLKPVL